MIVNIKNLSKSFGDKLVLNNINLNISKGEVFGLIGPNGAGKSTMIRIICGLLRKDKGDIEIFSKKFEDHKNYIKGKIGIVPQDLAIYENLTAYENVSFFASLYGLRGSELKESVLESLRFVGLEKNVKSFPKTFSGGMKRRLNIACGIVHKPDLVIMDEPTVGIDPQSRNHIISSIKKLNSDGATIIYTTHYMGEVESLCSRIGIIDNGIVIANGTFEELITLVSDSANLDVLIKDASDFDKEEFMKINGVEGVNIYDNNIVVTYKKEAMCLNNIIKYFTSNEIEIIKIEEENIDLENIFLKLTGRKLRD